MHMHRKLLAAGFIAGALVLAGCSSSGDEAASETTTETTTETEVVEEAPE